MSRPVELDFGPDGALYVTNYGDHNVKKYDGQTGEYLGDFVPPRGGGLFFPHELEFRPDGYLYVVSSFTRQVKRYDAMTGAFIDNFITDRTILGPTYMLFEEVPEPGSLALLGSGGLFASTLLWRKQRRKA